MTTTPGAGSDAQSDKRVPVYILAGGKSRRFGSDKARALYDGVPVIVGVAALLRPIATDVTVVAARDDAYADLGLRTIGDVVPDKGPLGGLLTALDDMDGDGWLFLCACDWIGARIEWVHALMDRRRDDVEAIIYKGDRPEPLFGLYRGSVRASVRARMGGDDLSMRSFLQEIKTAWVAARPDWTRAINLNRPPDNKL